jgi:hypothetical protein
MSRTIRRTGLVAFVSLLAAAPPLAANALAATPKKGARFSGHIAQAPVVGFTAPVRFRVDPNGRSLDRFTFGSFGCFGAGGFRPGVNPYTGDSLIDAGSIKLAGNGHFAQTQLAGYTAAGQTSTFLIKVSGRFTKRNLASGTIQFTQTVTGVGSSGPIKCTSSPLSFTARS